MNWKKPRHSEKQGLKRLFHASSDEKLQNIQKVWAKTAILGVLFSKSTTRNLLFLQNLQDAWLNVNFYIKATSFASY